MFEGNRGTKTILGNRNIENKFLIFGEQGNKPILFQGNKGTCTPLGGPHECEVLIEKSVPQVTI